MHCPPGGLTYLCNQLDPRARLKCVSVSVWVCMPLGARLCVCAWCVCALMCVYVCDTDLVRVHACLPNKLTLPQGPPECLSKTFFCLIHPSLNSKVFEMKLTNGEVCVCVCVCVCVSMCACYINTNIVLKTASPRPQGYSEVLFSYLAG